MGDRFRERKLKGRFAVLRNTTAPYHIHEYTIIPERAHTQLDNKETL